ncbi:MAG: peptide deformylase [Spirochaetia bacterium]
MLHEIDHLNGTLFIDRLPEKRKQRLIKLYNKRERL